MEGGVLLLQECCPQLAAVATAAVMIPAALLTFSRLSLPPFRLSCLEGFYFLIRHRGLVPWCADIQRVAGQSNGDYRHMAGQLQCVQTLLLRFPRVSDVNRPYFCVLVETTYPSLQNLSCRSAGTVSANGHRDKHSHMLWTNMAIYGRAGDKEGTFSQK